jgi:hypothetical protein
MAEDKRKSENLGCYGGFAAKMGRLRRAIPTLGFRWALPRLGVCGAAIAIPRATSFPSLKYIYYLKQRVVLFSKTYYEA